MVLHIETREIIEAALSGTAGGLPATDVARSPWLI